MLEKTLLQERVTRLEEKDKVNFKTINEIHDILVKNGFVSMVRHHDNFITGCIWTIKAFAKAGIGFIALGILTGGVWIIRNYSQ